MKKIFLFLFLVGISLASCSKKQEEKVDYGTWQKMYYTDEYGDNTKDFYSVGTGEGSYSTNNSNGKLEVYMFIDGKTQEVSFKFLEKGVHLAKEIRVGQIEITDGHDNVYYKDYERGDELFASRGKILDRRGEFLFNDDQEAKSFLKTSTNYGGTFKIKLSLVGTLGNRYYAGKIEMYGYRRLIKDNK